MVDGVVRRKKGGRGADEGRSRTNLIPVSVWERFAWVSSLNAGEVDENVDPNVNVDYRGFDARYGLWGREVSDDDAGFSAQLFD